MSIDRYCNVCKKRIKVDSMSERDTNWYLHTRFSQKHKFYQSMSYGLA